MNDRAMRGLRQVVIVLDNANVDGGTGKVALASAGALAERGYDVCVFSAVPANDGTRSRFSERIRFVATGQRIVLEDPAIARAALRGIWNAEAYRLLRETLRPLDAASTIVHVHGWTKALSSSVIRAAIDSRATLAVSLHDFFTICPAGTLFDHPRNEICRRTPMSLACITANCDSRSYAHKGYRVARQLVSVRAGHIPLGVRNYIAVSKFSRNILEPHLPAGASIYDVPNPVEAPLAEPVAVAKNDAYVFVGRLSAEKGPLLFARAMAKLGYRAIFAGDGELREAVRGILPDAEITGWLDGAGLASVLGRARAIVVPSLCYETFGLVVLEAASAGIPAIVPDESAANDLIVEGESGSAFRTGDLDSLVNVLQTYADDAMVTRLGAVARQRFWEHPSTLSVHVDRLLESYSAMLDRVGIPS